MLTVSDELKNAFMKPERTIYARIKVGNRTFDNDNVVSVEYDSGSLSGEVFAVGSTYSNSIKITFSELVEGLKELDEVSYEIGIKLSSGAIEYVPMGVFVINDAIGMDRNNNKTTIECMDRMIMMGGTYVSSLTYPAAIREVALEIANKAGIAVDSTSFARLSADKIAKPEGYTYREAMGLIAQFESGFATFNRYGKLEIRTLSDPNFAIPPDNYFSKGLVKNEVFFRLGGISCTTDDGDTIIQSGNSAGNQVVLENRVMTKVLLDKIYQKIQTINYYPFSLSWQGNPVIESGDWVEVEDLQGNKFKTPNLSYSLSFNGGLSAKSSAETVTQSGVTYQYKSPLQQKIEWIHARIDASGGNVVYEGINEPTNPKEGDLWFKVVGPDKEILIYKKDSNGNLFWEPQISTADIDKVAKEVEAAIADIDVEKTRIDQTILKADQAIADAGFIKLDVAQVKSDALTTANTAQTAYNNAVSALTNAATAISTANTAKTNAGTALTTAQTSLANSGIALTNAQTALDAYNNLEIGGRNLELNSAFANSNSWRIYNGLGTTLVPNATNKTLTATYPNNTQIAIQGNSVTGVLEGEKYTVSAIFNSNHSGSIQYVIKFQRINLAELQESVVKNGYVANSNVRYSHTFTIPKDVISFFVTYRSGNSTSSISDTNLMIKEPKIERGTKATDWSPAPEDVQVQITDINGELSRKVAQTTFDTLNGTVTNQGTQISQSQTAIGLKADKTLVDTINQTVANHTLSIKATADSLATKAEKSLVDSINQTVTKHTTDIKVTADGLALKSDKSVVDSINSIVNTHTSQIKATSDGLALKADSSLVNTVKGTVDTHTTQIKATSDGLALKAEKSLVDTINSTVGTHTTQIKTTSDGLALKAEKSLVDTVKSTVDKHTTDIKVVADGLALKAESSLVNTINGTVNTHTNQISANSTAIAARLTSAQVDSLVAAKKYVNETTLNATASGLSTSITQVSTDLSNLQIGGRNLLLNSKNIGNVSEKYEDFAVTKKIGQADTVSFKTPILDGLEYTVSFFAKSSVTTTIMNHFYSPNTTTDAITSTGQISNLSDGGIRTDVTTEWKRYWITWKQSSSGSAKSVIIGRVVAGQDVSIAGIKFEKGNKATDWSPAPEDMATLEKFTTLEATVNGINTTVGTKANQSQVTQLATQVSTKVESAAYNSKMTQLDSAINLRVTATEVNESILADKTIKDTRNVNSHPDYYYFSYAKQELRELKIGTVIGAITTAGVYGILTTKVPWGDYTGGNITQIFETSSGTYTRMGNSLGWLAWDKTAEVGKLVAQINLSPKGVLIQGKNIQLDGDVTMTNAFVNQIKAIEVIADKITSGTFNGANMNIINLNASSMTSGTLRGANYELNLNTGTQMFTNPTNGNSLIMNQAIIGFWNGNKSRYIEYWDEGLKIYPGFQNTGISANTGLQLIGGHSYIEFISSVGTGYYQRLEATGGNMYMVHAQGGALRVRQAGLAENTGSVISGFFKTSHDQGAVLTMWGDTISTPNYDNRDIHLVPNGTGSVIAGTWDGTRWNMKASDFIKQSTRKSKTDIKPIKTKGLDVIGRLTPVSYKKKDKVKEGIIETELGFIAEDSLEVATPDGEGIYDSHITAYLVKAVQELNKKIKQLESGK